MASVAALPTADQWPEYGQLVVGKIERADDARIRNKHVKDVFVYWLELAKDGRFPPRSALRPARMTSALPQLYIHDVIDNGFAYRPRLAGSAYCGYVGLNPVGKTYTVEDAKTNRVAFRTLECIHGILRTHSPIHAFTDVSVYPDRDYNTSEAVVMPLSEDGETIDQVLGVCWIEPRRY